MENFADGEINEWSLSNPHPSFWASQRHPIYQSHGWHTRHLLCENWEEISNDKTWFDRMMGSSQTNAPQLACCYGVQTPKLSVIKFYNGNWNWTQISMTNTQGDVQQKRLAFLTGNFKQILLIDGWGISCKTALIWMSLGFTDDKPTLVQVMAWCRQTTSHYLSQCWLSSLSPYGVTTPKRVNGTTAKILFLVYRILKHALKLHLNWIRTLWISVSMTKDHCYCPVHLLKDICPSIIHSDTMPVWANTMVNSAAANSIEHYIAFTWVNIAMLPIHSRTIYCISHPNNFILSMIVHLI